MILERFKVPAKDQVLVTEAALRRTVTQIFEKLGVSADDAAEGADVLRVHDVAEARQALTVAEAILDPDHAAAIGQRA